MDRLIVPPVLAIELTIGINLCPFFCLSICSLLTLGGFFNLCTRQTDVTSILSPRCADDKVIMIYLFPYIYIYIQCDVVHYTQDTTEQDGIMDFV